MLERYKAKRNLKLFQKAFEAMPSAIDRGIAGERRRFLTPSDLRKVRKGLKILKPRLEARGEKELLEKVDEALASIKEGNYARFSKAFQDYETLRNISAHANLPLNHERKE
ncbi:MAG: hypothetical protein QXO69_03370 [archaeon]